MHLFLSQLSVVLMSIEKWFKNFVFLFIRRGSIVAFMELSVFSDEPVTENEVGVLLSDLEMSLNDFAQQHIDDPFFPFVANQTVTIEGKLYCF